MAPGDDKLPEKDHNNGKEEMSEYGDMNDDCDNGDDSKAADSVKDTEKDDEEGCNKDGKGGKEEEPSLDETEDALFYFYTGSRGTGSDVVSHNALEHFLGKFVQRNHTESAF